MTITSIQKIDSLTDSEYNEYLIFVESQYKFSNQQELQTVIDNKSTFINLGDANNFEQYSINIYNTESCIIDNLNKIKFYDKDNSITNNPKLIYDITYHTLNPGMYKLLLILDVEREILHELHNYQIKHKRIGKNIFGHRFKIRCKYIYKDTGEINVVQSDLGYYEIELVFKNDDNEFVQIYNKYTDSEITQDPADKYINSIEKVLQIINSNTISLLSSNTESSADVLHYQKVSLNTIINNINKGESILALYQYKRVDYLKLILNDIIKRNINYLIKTDADITENNSCHYDSNTQLINNFNHLQDNFRYYVENNENDILEIYSSFANIISNKKATGRAWKKTEDITNHSDLSTNNKYNKLIELIIENYNKEKDSNGNAPDQIALTLSQIESLTKNDFYTEDSKLVYIKIDDNYYQIAYDNTLVLNKSEDEIYKTEKIFEKTTKLRDINDELEKKNKLLKTINSNVEFEKKKLDKINIVYIFTICLFILLSIILILLGSDKIDYKRGRNFINTLIFLTFIIFFGLHYYIGKIKETQKDSIKLNNILDDEIFKVKSTIEKFNNYIENPKEYIISKLNKEYNIYTILIVNYWAGIIDIINDNYMYVGQPSDSDDDWSFISFLKEKSKYLTDDTKSYYNVVDPLLNKELEDYDKRNENTKMYKNIADFNLNISRRDTKFSIETINYLLNLSLLLAIILLVMFYNSDFTAIIGVIGIIIFIIISILYFTRILRIVRTDNKKKYWQKPLESDLKKL